MHWLPKSSRLFPVHPNHPGPYMAEADTWSIIRLLPATIPVDMLTLSKTELAVNPSDMPKNWRSTNMCQCNVILMVMMLMVNPIIGQDHRRPRTNNPSPFPHTCCRVWILMICPWFHNIPQPITSTTFEDKLSSNFQFSHQNPHNSLSS